MSNCTAADFDDIPRNSLYAQTHVYGQSRWSGCSGEYQAAGGVEHPGIGATSSETV